MPTSLIIRATQTRLSGREPIPLEADEGDELQTIPLLGTVSAGQPLEMFEEAEELEVPAAWVRRNTFALRVRGGSMIDDDILDGDIIIVEQRSHADNGETVVARIHGDQATLKRLYAEPDHVRLQPANEAMEPLRLPPEEVEVLGVVRVIVRRT
jgi:repressor LexA